MEVGHGNSPVGHADQDFLSHGAKVSLAFSYQRMSMAPALRIAAGLLGRRKIEKIHFAEFVGSPRGDRASWGNWMELQSAKLAISTKTNDEVSSFFGSPLDGLATARPP